MFHFRVRNGTGWDHQAMTTRLRFAALLSAASTACPGRHVCCFLGALCSVVSACCFLHAGFLFQQADIRVARGCYFFLRLLTHLFQACIKGLSPWSDRGLSDVSSARLNTLLQLHLRPIYVVVFHAPIGRTHLGRDLALRCFQRLFLPHLATRPCS